MLPLGEIEFYRLVERELDMVGLSDNVGATLISDLVFDSLDMFRLVVVVESLVSSFILPDEVNFRDLTLGDVYHYYLQLREGDELDEA